MSNKIKIHIKKGDTVQVISGNYKGNTGIVLQVIPDKYRAIVEKINLVKRHRKPTAQNPEGKIEEFEAGIHISNLMLIDPSNGKPTRIGRKLNAENKLQRYSKITGEFI